ncbi:prepilin-type N-terminal cleavage/methylation domain-containing protein [Candidatus Arthromitus sp. SFB-turkey]|uniref:prepilin-type N-terminal cleavage/methylation domain-containing protein n=1 Tax=Candidatus Arthromitus sp. SFB-turkey TaxID=1840217 RepID=UPI0007F339C4|nr:prepilin-type N-terminal cleavage/methylation domain-containing protein [Candidatus Arthromitus sp. SFB-turkey]OAT88012.1 general secretion pathway protein GspG [Candidatus Arthromitus sp. SFB-turkey]HJD00915.1 prepilin-type N-terminal cleavage/methylation domain-containing protein [Candidatus Dwaynia gallinarum]
MKFQNKKKDGFSIIEVMVSFVIILVIVLLIGPNLFSTYERSKEMSKVSDANAIMNAVDMHNLNLFVDGDMEPISESTTMSEFKKVNDEKKYLNNWPKWVEDSMTIKNIRDIANRVEKSETISQSLDNRV